MKTVKIEIEVRAEKKLQTSIEVNGEEYDVIIVGKNPEGLLDTIVTGFRVMSDLEELQKKQDAGPNLELTRAFANQFKKADQMRESGEIKPNEDSDV